MYRLIRFGTTELEYLNQVDMAGSGASPVNYMALPGGGAMDGYGGATKLPGAVERGKQVRLWGATEAELEAVFMTLLGMQGKREKLYRRMPNGTIHWQYAKLVEVSAETSFEQRRYRKIQDVNLKFVTQDYAWRGSFVTPGGLFLDSGLFLDTGLLLDTGLGHTLGTSPDSYVVTCGTASDPGRAAITALKIRVDAGDVPMSGVTIGRTGGESLEYGGSIQVGGALEIDCGTMQVSCTGDSGAYDKLVFAPTADMGAWFSLQPGDNSITVTYTGGGVGKKISFEYYEAWR